MSDNVKVNLYQLLTEIKFGSKKLSNGIHHFSSALKVVTWCCSYHTFFTRLDKGVVDGGGSWCRPLSRLRERDLERIWRASLTPLWKHLLSWSNILILSLSSLCWWTPMWWPTGDESLLCSFRWCFSALSVSPTYCASQSWHVRWYTTPHLSSGLSLSFGVTSNFLMVVWGLVCAVPPAFLMSLLMGSVMPWT